MTTLRLTDVVWHDGRLNLLCCLRDAGPLPISQIAARIGESAQAVHYWISLLGAFGLVEKRDEQTGGESPYSVNLDGHPEWVRGVVSRHRPRAI